MLSSNSSSSRAIPFKKIKDPYFPFDIRLPQKGMQGYDKLSDKASDIFLADLMEILLITEDILLKWKDLIHKQHLNRYLESFTIQKKLITGTEWDNFFRLRLAEDAQPEIQELAKCMHLALDRSHPKTLSPGQYHLPYITQEERLEWITEPLKSIKCSIARCARVSYKNHDKTNPDIDRDLALYDQLLSSRHLSCFEHIATPMKFLTLVESLENREIMDRKGISHMTLSHSPKKDYLWSGNFMGWIQYRKLVE